MQLVEVVLFESKLDRTFSPSLIEEICELLSVADGLVNSVLRDWNATYSVLICK